MDGLGKVFRIADTTQYKTVREFVVNYEGKYGQLSLDKWRSIFQHLGYLEDFEKLLAADQMQLMGHMNALDTCNSDCPSVAANQSTGNNTVNLNELVLAGSRPQEPLSNTCKSNDADGHTSEDYTLSALTEHGECY